MEYYSKAKIAQIVAVKSIVDKHYKKGEKGGLKLIYEQWIKDAYGFNIITFYRMMRYAAIMDGFIGLQENRRETPNGLKTT